MNSMRANRLVVALAFIALANVLPVAKANAQPLGTFAWRFSPHCNIVALSVVQQGAVFSLTGTDDECGAVPSGVVGTARFNPDGTIGLSLLTVRAGSSVIENTITLNAVALSGPWLDADGNTGSFDFGAVSPAPGAPRPSPSGALGPGVVMTANLAPLAVTADKLADGAVNGAKIVAGSVGGVHIAPGAVGSSHIGFGAVGGSAIASGSVGSSHIATGAVGSSEIADGAVGTAELREAVTFGTAVANGAVDVQSAVSDRIVTTLATNTGGGGYARVRSNDGQEAIVLSTTGGGVAGYLTVHNSAGTAVAGINGSNGNVWGTTKSFVVPDPSDADRMIRYTSLEGPEAAIYVRGVAALADGVGRITFPNHFRSMVVPSSITVALTPRSAASLGLAAVDVSADGVQVRELGGGGGSYRFDFVAYGVRLGYENYEVYSDREETDSALAPARHLPKVDVPEEAFLSPLPSRPVSDPWGAWPRQQ